MLCRYQPGIIRFHDYCLWTFNITPYLCQILYMSTVIFVVVLFSGISRVRPRENIHFIIMPIHSNENIRKIIN